MRSAHTVRVLCLAAVCCTTGCVDLAEPHIPSLGAPAIFNITIRDIPGLPISASGTLNPGREVSGVRRTVASPLILLQTAFTLPAPNTQGTIALNLQPPQPPAGFTGPYDLQPPLIEGIATPTTFRWYGLRKLDPDTVYPDERGDVALHIDADVDIPIPLTRTQQWFLELRGDRGSIRVSGDGVPPEILRIPSQFVPPAPDGTVDITLIYFQSATTRPPPGDYITSVTLDVRTQWILRTSQ
jgi:hypothetical protein